MNLGYLFAKKQLYQISAMQLDIVIVTAMSWNVVLCKNIKFEILRDERHSK